MPRIDDNYLDCSIYLYPSVEAAKEGRAAGGTGFLASVPCETIPNATFIYAVTNAHVIRNGSPVIRLNTQAVAVDIAPLRDADWTPHPDGDDLAVTGITGLSVATHKFRTVPISMFLTREVSKQYNIGPGEDVFVVGRFVTVEGRQKNTPSARFGHIAMMPGEPIRTDTGVSQESFVVEAKSISGYSGSPVFVRILPLSLRPEAEELATRGWTWLLGVDWGHINDPRIRDAVRDPKGILVGTVEANTGMMAVVPAWRLLDFLMGDKLVMVRRKSEQKIKEKKVTDGSVSSDSMSQEDFEAILKQVSKKTDAPDRATKGT